MLHRAFTLSVATVGLLVACSSSKSPPAGGAAGSGAGGTAGKPTSSGGMTGTPSGGTEQGGADNGGADDTTGGATTSGGSGGSSGRGGTASGGKGGGHGGKAGGAGAGATTGGSATAGRANEGGAGDGIEPNPLISGGKAVTIHPGNQATMTTMALTDGDFTDGGTEVNVSPTSSAPVVFEIDVGAGHDRVLFKWQNYSPDYDFNEWGAPVDYTVEACDSGGSDCTQVAHVTDNPFRARSHVFDFAGKTLVRMTVTKSNDHTQLDEITVHDVSAGGEDTWAFFGSSYTRFLYSPDLIQQDSIAWGSFEDRITAAHPDFQPATINVSFAGGTVNDWIGPGTGSQSEIEDFIDANDGYHFWVLHVGFTDSDDDQDDVSSFTSSLKTLVAKVKGKGKVPVLVGPPYTLMGHANQAKYHEAVQTVASQEDVLLGPDFYQVTMSDTSLLCDNDVDPCSPGKQPNDKGFGAMLDAWPDAAGSIYP